MIIDFIKSWFYYPKLKKRLERSGQSESDEWGTRWNYAKWHCGRVYHCIKWHFRIRKIKKSMKNSDWDKCHEEELEQKELEDLFANYSDH